MNTQTLPAKRDFSAGLERAMPSMRDALPEHVDEDRFKRILSSAVMSNPDLQRAYNEFPQSIWNSAMACAKDGLIPDGREAALVVFNTKQKFADGVERKVATAQYMPMVGGILKMLRQSGEVQSMSANVVYEKDDFDYELGDDERIQHKPFMGGDRGKMIAVYAVLRTKDGGLYREVMSRSEVEAVKRMSRGGQYGPWNGPFESEMWRKTVIRRAAKRWPISTDVIDLIQRDDGMYALPGTNDNPLPAPKRTGFSLSTGETYDVEPDQPETSQDILDGDDIPEAPSSPGEQTASQANTPQDEPASVQDDQPEEPAEKPKTKAKTKEPAPKEDKAEADSEPEKGPVDGDKFADSDEVKQAISECETQADFDAVMKDAKTCSWVSDFTIRRFNAAWDARKEELGLE